MDWKKEIKLSDLGRRNEAEPPSEGDAPAAGEPSSVWKKEISFGRKRKAGAAEASPAEDASAGAAATPADEKTSIWKKELTFGRRKAASAEPDPEPAQDPEPPAQPAPIAPYPATTAEPAAPPAAEAVPGPLLHEPAQPDLAWPTSAAAGDVAATFPAPVADPFAAPEAPAGAGFQLPPTVSAPAAEQPDAIPSELPPLEALPHLPETAAEYLASFGAAPPAAEAVPDGPVSGLELGAPEAVAPPPPAPLPAPSAAPTPATGPPTVTASPPGPAPGIHPPVPASELPPLPADEQPKKSLLKRELSFGRKGKGPKTPKAKKGPDATDATAPEPGAPARGPATKPKGGKGGSRQKRLVGLKVGGSQLAAARVINNGHAELVQVARDDLPAGIVVGGELRDPDALAAALKTFFRKHKLPKRGVRLGIANNRIGVRTFEIAGITDPKQLANAIKFRAQEALPIPIEEAVLDYHVLDEGVDENGEPVTRILLVVAYRELIDRYMNACKKAGIALVGIDLEAFALLRSLAAPAGAPATDAALVAVSIGHERTTFAVSDGRTCEFTRVLEWGGASLNVAIARELDSSPEEVETIKRSISLLDDRLPEGLAPEIGHAARETVRRQIQAFARELVSSLQFYQNQPGSLGIGEIVITGGTTHLPGLAEELQRLIGVRVAIGDPLVRVKVGKKVGDQPQIGSLSVAIGLGIED